MGSKSNTKIMKSYQDNKKKAEPKKSKKENAQDIISKSFTNYLKGSGRYTLIL